MHESSTASPSNTSRIWVEVIRLRTPGDDAEERARNLQQALDATLATTPARRVQVFVHATVRSDLLVLVEHTTDGPDRPESVLGYSLEEALRQYGSVTRSLWISPSTPGASSRNPGDGR